MDSLLYPVEVAATQQPKMPEPGTIKADNMALGACLKKLVLHDRVPDVNLNM